MNCSVLGAGEKVSAGQGGLLGAGHSWFQQTHRADACTAAQGTAHIAWLGGLFSNVTLACEQSHNFCSKEIALFQKDNLSDALRGQSGFHPLAISR